MDGQQRRMNKGKEIKIENDEKGTEIKMQQNSCKFKITTRKHYKIKMANDDEAGPSGDSKPMEFDQTVTHQHQETDELVTGEKIDELLDEILGPCTYMFPEDVPKLPPDQEMEFTIDLLPGIDLISLTPYQMAPAEQGNGSYQELKYFLTQAPVFAFPDRSKEFEVYIDASHQVDALIHKSYGQLSLIHEVRLSILVELRKFGVQLEMENSGTLLAYF
ncbi:hypothetical protein ACFX13_007187 [Malus domestica]